MNCKKGFKIKYAGKFITTFELRCENYPILDALMQRAPIVALDFVRIELDINEPKLNELELVELKYIPPHQIWHDLMLQLTRNQYNQIDPATTWVNKFSRVLKIVKSKKIQALAYEGLKACEERVLDGTWASLTERIGA